MGTCFKTDSAVFSLVMGDFYPTKVNYGRLNRKKRSVDFLGHLLEWSEDPPFGIGEVPFIFVIHVNLLVPDAIWVLSSVLFVKSQCLVGYRVGSWMPTNFVFQPSTEE